MVTASALVRGGALHLLDRSPEERPVALQLGGSDPDALAEAARIGAAAGYDEINLNCGCPSDRAQSGTFGAILMKDPARVAACVAAMRAASSVEVTVKCRIGVDDRDPRQALPAFIDRVAGAGCRRFVVHARKAWLQGLSPKENRDIPPLDHDLVLAMKTRFPALHISINGGIASLSEARHFLAQGLDGVMIGRVAYRQPADILAAADPAIFGTGRPRDPVDAVWAMESYISRHIAMGGRLHQITRHMLGAFAGRPGARHWRRMLSEGATRPGADFQLVERALSEIRPLAPDARTV